MTKFGSGKLKEYERKVAQKKMYGRDDDDEETFKKLGKRLA